MGDKWSKHIWKSETACKCGCGLNRMSAKIIDRAEIARAMVNLFFDDDDDAADGNEIKLCITSGSRCKAHNEAVGGSKNSEHIARLQKPTFDMSDMGQDSNAVDGWFYLGNNPRVKGNRIDASEVLIYMWDCELLQGLILYDKYRFHISTGRRYSSWKDLRGVK